jgi:hypothetical protein
MQRHSPDAADRERAFREYLSVLDNLLAREPKSEVYSTLAFDKTITLARLAQLMEQRDTTKGAELFAASVAQCKSIRTGDCSEASIREWVAYLDRDRQPTLPPK